MLEWDILTLATIILNDSCDKYARVWEKPLLYSLWEKGENIRLFKYLILPWEKKMPQSYVWKTVLNARCKLQDKNQLMCKLQSLNFVQVILYNVTGDKQGKQRYFQPRRSKPGKQIQAVLLQSTRVTYEFHRIFQLTCTVLFRPTRFGLWEGHLQEVLIYWNQLLSSCSVHASWKILWKPYVHHARYIKHQNVLPMFKRRKLLVTGTASIQNQNDTTRLLYSEAEHVVVLWMCNDISLCIAVIIYLTRNSRFYFYLNYPAWKSLTFSAYYVGLHMACLGLPYFLSLYCKRTIFRNKYTLNKKCVFIFCTTFIWPFLNKTNSENTLS